MPLDLYAKKAYNEIMTKRKVKISKKAEKQLRAVQQSIYSAYKLWLSVILSEGVKGLRSYAGFKDHALTGNRKGERASRLSRTMRIIYKVTNNGEIELIDIIEVNSHDYRKK